LYPIRLAVEIEAPVERVWLALCAPAEVVIWDSGVTAALDAPSDYPRAGQHVRWRVGSGWFRLLHDRPLEVVPQQRLRSRLSLGPYDMDEAYVLEPAASGCKLGLSVDLTVRIPLLGRTLESRWAGPSISRGFEASLQGLKRYCENQEQPQALNRDLS
jgi:uncharacterized protein YndB with AHSA1/START domain